MKGGKFSKRSVGEASSRRSSVGEVDKDKVDKDKEKDKEMKRGRKLSDPGKKKDSGTEEITFPESTSKKKEEKKRLMDSSQEVDDRNVKKCKEEEREDDVDLMSNSSSDSITGMHLEIEELK